MQALGCRARFQRQQFQTWQEFSSVSVTHCVALSDCELTQHLTHQHTWVGAWHWAGTDRRCRAWGGRRQRCGRRWGGGRWGGCRGGCPWDAALPAWLCPCQQPGACGAAVDGQAVAGRGLGGTCVGPTCAELLRFTHCGSSRAAVVRTVRAEHVVFVVSVCWLTLRVAP
jgi:hypothetical protein